MTAQSPDKLDNAYPDIDFGPLKLYRVVTGDIQSNSGWGEPYPFSSPPTLPGDQRSFSSLWRGYVSHFRLSADGTLTLLSYTYPNSPSLGRNNRQTVNETLVGAFWLVMKPAFRAPRTYVPFHDGIIVLDRSEWKAPS